MRDKRHLLIKTSDNEEAVREIRNALKKNDGYCPCKVEHKRENRCVFSAVAVAIRLQNN